MRVAVIGGGGSGCVVLRELVSQGFDAVLFEASDALGGVWWSYRYDSLTTNISRKVTELSCAPLAGDTLFAQGDELCDYYASLAPPGRYQLLCPVKLVQQEGDGFLVTLAAGGKLSFDAIVCCTGTFQKPDTTVEWLPSYDGPWMHSCDYRFPELFIGRRVVLIGIGNSSLDISLDLVGHAASVTVCSNGTHLVPVLDETMGLPIDYNLLSFDFHQLSGFEKLAHLMSVGEPLTRKFVEKGMPPCTNGRLSILKNQRRYVAALEADKIFLKCAVKSAHGSNLVLNDGSVIRADVVLLCTGFRMDFSFLAPELNPLVPKVFEQDYCALYKHVIHPESPRLFFVGYFDTFHNQVAVSEMQARWVSRVLLQQILLPSKEEMQQWVKQQLQRDLKTQGPKTKTPLFRHAVQFMLMYANDMKDIEQRIPKKGPVVGKNFVKVNDKEDEE